MQKPNSFPPIHQDQKIPTSEWVSEWNFLDARPGDWLKLPKNNKAVRKIWGHDRMPWFMYPDAPELFTYLPNHALVQITGPNKRIRSQSWIPVAYNNQPGWLRKDHAKTCFWRPTLLESDMHDHCASPPNPFMYPLALAEANPGKMVRVGQRHGTIVHTDTTRLPLPEYQARVRILDDQGKTWYAWLQECYSDTPPQNNT